jgi:hypothetical protein
MKDHLALPSKSPLGEQTETITAIDRAEDDYEAIVEAARTAEIFRRFSCSHYLRKLTPFKYKMYSVSFVYKKRFDMFPVYNSSLKIFFQERSVSLGVRKCE